MNNEEFSPSFMSSYRNKDRKGEELPTKREKLCQNLKKNWNDLSLGEFGVLDPGNYSCNNDNKDELQSG